MFKLIPGSFWKLREGNRLCKLIYKGCCYDKGVRSVVVIDTGCDHNYRSRPRKLIVQNEDSFSDEYEPLDKIDVVKGDVLKDAIRAKPIKVISKAIHEDTKEEFVIYRKMNSYDDTTYIKPVDKLNEILESESEMIPRFTKEGNMRDL